MKKLYTSPMSSEINICVEGMIATSQISEEVSEITFDESSSSEAGTVLSNESDMWGSEDMWQ